LNRDAFDVADVDDAATSFPELNFIVNHVGMPRLDDFTWIAAQEPNVYGGLAVVAPLALSRPRKFGEIIGELLFWLGEDRILYGSDYGLWEPEWVIEAVMDLELTDEQEKEYGMEFDLEKKRKIMGENAAELYGIDIEEKKRQFEFDEVSERFDLGEAYTSEAAAD
jgi:predicted TIM-barrel fold metal-dependent hydrolase